MDYSLYKRRLPDDPVPARLTYEDVVATARWEVADRAGQRGREPRRPRVA